MRPEGFGTHLHAYLALFQGLPAFEFVYIAPTPRLFQAAESPFQQVVNGRRLGGKSVSLLDYFRLRKAWVADPLGNSAENLAGTRFERLRAPGFR